MKKSLRSASKPSRFFTTITIILGIVFLYFSFSQWAFLFYTTVELLFSNTNLPTHQIASVIHLALVLNGILLILLPFLPIISQKKKESILTTSLLLITFYFIVYQIQLFYFLYLLIFGNWLGNWSVEGTSM